MKTTSGKVQDEGKAKLSAAMTALIENLNDDELRSLRGAINNKLRKTRGGGRPRKRSK